MQRDRILELTRPRFDNDAPSFAGYFSRAWVELNG